MTWTQFTRGYWYADELKAFAKKIGIPSAGQLRKDELEQAIKVFLQFRKIVSPAKERRPKSRVKDVERGLSLDLPVESYTNDKETKGFLEREALKLSPGLKRKSGVRYRLNRWREQRIADGVRITYRDLVKEHVRLSRTVGSFAHIPHGRYINFMSDFMAAEPNATRAQAIKAWKTLKTLDAPKDYRSWKTASVLHRRS
jgi:hypothetical protein